MKFGGITLEGPKPEVVVFVRGDKQLVFKCAPVLDFEDFDNLCPRPNPPMVIKKGETVSVPDIDNADYKKAIFAWVTVQTDWMCLQSLKATPEVEWETVDVSDSVTFKNWRTEMKAAGFSILEVTLIVEAVTTASGLNQAKMDDARKAFLAGAAQAAKE